MTEKKRDPDKSKKLIAKYKKVFGSPEGQEVLQNLFLVNFGMSSTQVPGDPYTSAKHDGMRDAITRIVIMSEADPLKLTKAILIEEGSHV